MIKVSLHIFEYDIGQLGDVSILKLEVQTNVSLVQYIGECMVSIINTNNDNKEPTHGYQNCDTKYMLIFE